MPFSGAKFSPVIQLGSILNSLSIVGTLIGAVWYVGAAVAENKKDIDYAKQSIQEIKQTQLSTLQTLNTLTSSVSKIEGRLSIQQETNK